LRDTPMRMPKQGREPPLVADEEAMVVNTDRQVIYYEAVYYIPEYL
jgi:hypothetical protein